MKYIACNLCGSADTATLFIKGKEKMSTNPVEYTLVKCSCGFVYQNPQPTPEEQAAFYNEEYSPYVSSDVFEKGPIFKAIRGIKERISPSREFVPTITHDEKIVLDFGSGSGQRMNSVKRSHPNWKVYGFDVASNTKRDDIIIGTIDDIKLPPLDEIYMGNVLEHLTIPLQDLTKLHALLKPGGKIFIDVPNIGSIKFKLFKGDWSSLDLPRHLQHFDKDTARRMLEKAGFTIEKMSTSGNAKGTLRSLCYAFGYEPQKLNAAGIYLITRISRLFGNVWDDEELNIIAVK